MNFEKIQIKNLTKSFKNPDGNRSIVLQNISFELKKGGLLRLSGPSGCGKTTFLNLIAALIKPDSGSIFVGETDITKLSEGAGDSFRAENIGYIFQTFNLLPPFSVLENIFLPSAFANKLSTNYKEDALKSLEKVGMRDFACKMPYQLSVGQKQRVAIARALFASPSIILADEPTSGLDAKSSEIVKETLLGLNKDGTTLILTSHDKIFDNIACDLNFNLEEVRI